MAVVIERTPTVHAEYHVNSSSAKMFPNFVMVSAVCQRMGRTAEAGTPWYKVAHMKARWIVSVVLPDTQPPLGCRHRERAYQMTPTMARIHQRSFADDRA
jgi:hypothetical protein